SLKGSARYVLPKINHGKLVFNGKIIGMRGDPLPPGASPPPPIRLHIARFFDGQCSNEMCNLKVAHLSYGSCRSLSGQRVGVDVPAVVGLPCEVLVAASP